MLPASKLAVISVKITLELKPGNILKHFLILICTASLGASVFVYEANYAYSRQPNRFYEIGKTIGQSSLEHEVVFAISPVKIPPNIIYYSGRNIQSVKTYDEARTWLEIHARKKGSVFHIDSNYKIIKNEKVFLKNSDFISSSKNETS